MKLDRSLFDQLKPMPPFKADLRDVNRKNLKTQTRRVIKPQPPHWTWNHYCFDERCINIANHDDKDGYYVICPYGQPGDLRYMREPLIRDGGYARYKDDGEKVISLLTGDVIEWRWKRDVISQLYMPKEAARIFKRYEFIHVERLQEISLDGIRAEGVVAAFSNHNGKDFWDLNNLAIARAEQIGKGFIWGVFANKWDSINMERGYGWAGNWWVWVIGYQYIDFNVRIPIVEV